ncbi:Mor transcription activator family protein [Paraburkholderia fungorum]|uniref:Mor transcription activator family protein n=1 Tax=Paraburkholderia fungorum TaxID=134537 RepID=UPI00402BBC81
MLHERYCISWPEGYHEQLADIGDIIATGLSRLGLNHDQIKATAFAITEAIRRECGGVYLPRGTRFELSQREDDIWREFNGANYSQLAKKHGHSEVHIRSIVKRGKARDQARRQMALFDAD